MRPTLALVLLFFSASGHVQDGPPVDLTGVWSTNSLDTLGNPAWDLEGLLSCRCAIETYDYLRELLGDPANDYLSAEDLIRMTEAHTLQVVRDRVERIRPRIRRQLRPGRRPRHPVRTLRRVSHHRSLRSDRIRNAR